MIDKRKRIRTPRETEVDKVKLVGLVEQGVMIKDALVEIGCTDGNYQQWRQRDKNFRARMNAARERARTGNDRSTPLSARDGFAGFRWKYFGNPSPWLHLAIIEAFENTRPGNITMILVPPESGKTSLFEDYGSMKLAVDPSFRFTVGSENLTLASKILGKVQDRMDPEIALELDYINDFGPFAPQTATGRASRQTWNRNAFNVYRKPAGEQRDFNMQALGFRAKIAGTRTDHLHCDDMQSAGTLNQTEEMARVFRQDWLSRPGENAPTTIAGTRVGEGDLYEVLEESISPDILKIIRFPAIVTRTDENGAEVTEPLIERDEERKFGWTMEQLERLREKVGEDAWANNYMQNPRARTSLTFDEELIGRCLNPQRSITHTEIARNETLYFSLDPAIGSYTGIVAAAVRPEKITLLRARSIHGLMRNEDIMQQVERTIKTYVQAGGYATELVIEAKNFQAGLARDERLLEICDRYGLNAREHLTDMNKYDENIGVSSMTHTFRKAQFDIPWAADDETRTEMQQLINELLAWRPAFGRAKLRGNRLRQDLVMALWFVWIFWRERQGERYDKSKIIQRSGMPYAPTRSGLLTPQRYAS